MFYKQEVDPLVVLHKQEVDPLVVELRSLCLEINSLEFSFMTDTYIGRCYFLYLDMFRPIDFRLPQKVTRVDWCDVFLIS